MKNPLTIILILLVLTSCAKKAKLKIDDGLRFTEIIQIKSKNLRGHKKGDIVTLETYWFEGDSSIYRLILKERLREGAHEKVIRGRKFYWEYSDAEIIEIN